MKLFNKSFLILFISLCLFSNSSTMEEDSRKEKYDADLGDDYEFDQNSDIKAILAPLESGDENGVGFNALPREIRYMIIKELIKKLICQGISRKRLRSLFLISKEFYDHMNYIFNNDQELVNEILIFKLSLSDAEVYVKSVTSEANKLKLGCAIEKKKFSKVLYLLMGGSDVNVKDYCQGPLATAVINDAPHQIIEMLLYDADTSSINEALIAITHPWNHESGINHKGRYVNLNGPDRKELINTLLAHPAADINALCSQLFFYVAERGYKELVEKLLIHIDDINIQNDDGNTALILAARSDHEDLVEFLLANHANADIQNRYGNTALILAAGGNCTDSVQLLLANHVDIDKQNNEGWTALMTALTQIQYTFTAKMIGILLKANANPNLQNDNGETALIIVCKYHREDERLILTKIITTLLEAHADIKKRDNNGKSALDYAKEHNDHRIENLLNQANSWCLIS